jgi:small subunit ribosomal protein S4e
MARGPKKHLKRIAAPKSWMLDKITGVWAPRPSTGPHKLRESIPLTVVLRNRLKYALTAREANVILNDKEGAVRVDNKIRRDQTFPAGVMDVLTLEKTNENFRVLYDVKGRFVLKTLKPEEAKFKLCRIKGKMVGPNKIPYIITHDGRSIRFPHPDIATHDTIKLDLVQNKVSDHVKFELGNVATIIGGNNRGRVGIITARDRHLGGFDIVHLRDARGHTFATRISNVFVVGKGKSPWITLPRDAGIYYNALDSKEEREKVGAKGKKKTA